MDQPTPFKVDQLVTCMARVGIPPGMLARFDEDMSDNLQAYVSSSAWSTLEGFRTDITRWTAWAAANDVDMLKPLARNVRDFIRVFEDGRKPATIKSMLANIGVLTAAICGNTNITHTKIVRAELKRVRREKGSQQKQAMPIRLLGEVTSMDDQAQPFSVQRMVEALDKDPCIFSIRGKFLLSLCGDTARRHGEYFLADIRHLSEAADGEGTFHVDRSKTDQDGNGITRWTSKRTMRFFREWKQARENAGELLTPDSPLLVSVDFWGNPRPRTHMSSQGYHIALRRAVRTALERMVPGHPELESQIDTIVTKISGHSFRVGKVQDLVTAGEPITAICIEGGWETPSMPILYGRNLSVKNGASARLQRRLGDQ